MSHSVMDLEITDPRIEMYMMSSNSEVLARAIREANKRLGMDGGGDFEVVLDAQTVTMPLWSVAEALSRRRAMNPSLSAEAVETNMRRYGMTAREAFHGGDDLFEQGGEHPRVAAEDGSLSALLLTSDGHSVAQELFLHRRHGMTAP